MTKKFDTLALALLLVLITSCSSDIRAEQEFCETMVNNGWPQGHCEGWE